MLRLSLFPNNQFNCIRTDFQLSRKIVGDDTARREAERKAGIFEGFEQVLRFDKNLEGVQLEYKEIQGKVYKCVPYYNGNSGGVDWIPLADVQAANSQAVSLLDIYREGQPAYEIHSSWGKSHKPRRFTQEARYNLLRAGGAIDHGGYKDDCLAVTLTIPGHSQEAFEQVANWSGWLTNRLNQLLRRRDKRAKEKRFRGYFYTWEFQKRGALHLHYCLCGYDQGVAESFVNLWYKLLNELTEKTSVNLFLNKERNRDWRESPEHWQFDIFRVEKSVAAYFAKYCSKGAEFAKPLEEEREKETKLYYPGRFTGVSSSIRDLIREQSCQIQVDGLTREQEDYLVSRLSTAIEPCVKTTYERDFVIFGEPRPEKGYVDPLLISCGYSRTSFIDPSKYQSALTIIRAFKKSLRQSRDLPNGIVSF